MARKVFISYRRHDSAGYAGRVHDHLAAEFGRDLLFMDVDAVPLGSNFVSVVTKAVSECDALIALIGPNWLEVKDEYGRRRLDNPSDFVRTEIRAALQREIPVIPILLEGTRVPKPEDLPDDIEELAERNGLEVRHSSFHADMDKLIRSLRAESDVTKSDRIAAGGSPETVVGKKIVLWVCAIAALVFAFMMEGPNAPRSIATDPVEEFKRILEACKPGPLDDILGPVPGKLPCVNGKFIGYGQSFRDCPDCPEMVVVPAGSFMMGSHEYDNEKPVRGVTIAKPFAVGKFEVTFADWGACVKGGDCTRNPNPGDRGWGKGRRPVINVSWRDAKEYGAWLSAKTGKSYRLLSEAEWEYSARAGTTTKYAFGDTITTSQAQFSADQTAAVGTFPPNAWGLYDMHGNVWEWCEDNWHLDYQGAPTDGSVWPGGDTSLRVLRGGSWLNLHPDERRSSTRSAAQPSGRDSFIGFRVARTLN